MPFLDKIKLLETVKNKYEAGDIALSDDDKSRIEAETRDLIEKSLLNKEAMPIPEGFEMLLDQLKMADPQKAFDLVVDFMKEKGLVKGPEMGEPGMGPGMDHEEKEKHHLEKMDQHLDKVKDIEQVEQVLEKGPEKDLGQEPGKDLEKPVQEKIPEKDMEMEVSEKPVDLGDKDKGEMGEEKKVNLPLGKDEGPDPVKKEEPEKKEKEDKKEKKDKDRGDYRDEKGEVPGEQDTGPHEYEKKSSEQGDEDESSEKDTSSDDKEEKKEEKEEKSEEEKDKKAVNLNDLKKEVISSAKELDMAFEDEEEDRKVSEDELGIEKDAFKVKVTKAGNIQALKGDKVLFVAIPNKDVKASKTDLRRTANKVAAWLRFEGVEKAAHKCGAKIMAGVDEGIDFGGAELPSASDSVDDEGSEVIKEDLREKEEDSLKNQDDDIEEEKDKVTPKTTVARYEIVKKKADDVLDDAEVVHEEGVEKPSDSSLDESEEDHEEPKEEPSADAVPEEADFDFKSAEDHFKKLYATRAKKEAEQMFSSFLDKFNTCIRIASTRMLLNHDSDPLKVAMADILINEDQNIYFSDGEPYGGIQEQDAVELIECIASEGHSRFVDKLVKRALELMEKSEDYIQDVSSDLEELVPVSVKAKQKTASRKESLSEELEEGNFELKGTKTASSGRNFRDDVRASVSGGFRVSDQLNRISRKF